MEEDQRKRGRNDGGGENTEGGKKVEKGKREKQDRRGEKYEGEKERRVEKIEREKIKRDYTDIKIGKGKKGRKKTRGKERGVGRKKTGKDI